MELQEVVDLEAEATRLEQKAARLDLAFRNAEARAKELHAPYEARRQAISYEEQWDKNVIDADAEVEAARRAVWASVPSADPKAKSHTASSLAAETRARAIAARAALTVPTNEDEFAKFLASGARPFEGFTRHAYRIVTRKATAMGPFILLSASDSYGGQDSGERVYLAVAGDPPAIKGWLRVEPSEHRGDSTRARGEVDGKPFLRMLTWRNELADATEAAGSYGSSVRKPLAQFKAALLGDLKHRDSLASGTEVA